MLVEPRPLVEFIESMPAMVENCRSSGVATDDAMVSGLAPGKLGDYLDGRDNPRWADRSPAARDKPTMPNSRMAEHDQRGHDRPADEEFRDTFTGLLRCLCRAAPVRRSRP